MAKSPERKTSRVRLFATGSVMIAALVAGVIWMTRASTVPAADPVAPDVVLEFFDGSTQSLSELRGRPVVLNFWASWCPACVSEMPAFGDVHRLFGDQVEFIGVNMQEVDAVAAAGLVERTNVDYRLARDPNGTIFNLFGGIAMPTTVLISSSGAVLKVHAGVLFEDELTAIIESELLG